MISKKLKEKGIMPEKQALDPPWLRDLRLAEARAYSRLVDASTGCDISFALKDFAEALCEAYPYILSEEDARKLREWLDEGV